MYRKVTINYSNNEDQTVFVTEKKDEWLDVWTDGMFVFIQYDGGMRMIHSGLIGSVVAEEA